MNRELVRNCYGEFVDRYTDNFAVPEAGDYVHIHSTINGSNGPKIIMDLDFYGLRLGPCCYRGHEIVKKEN